MFTFFFIIKKENVIMIATEYQTMQIYRRLKSQQRIENIRKHLVIFISQTIQISFTKTRVFEVLCHKLTIKKKKK